MALDERVWGGPSFLAETPLSPLNSDTLRTMIGMTIDGKSVLLTPNDIIV
jgi:hypothetical protein